MVSWFWCDGVRVSMPVAGAVCCPSVGGVVVVVVVVVVVEEVIARLFLQCVDCSS